MSYGDISSALRISNGDLFYLPAFLPDSSGNSVPLTSNTEISIFPIISAEACATPISGILLSNNNAKDTLFIGNLPLTKKREYSTY